MLAVAAGGAGLKLRHQARRQQELEPERQLVGAPGSRGLGVQQLQLVAQQVEDGGIGVAGLEQARHGVAGAGGAVQAGVALAQAGVRRHGLGGGDREQVAPPLVQDQPQPEERLQPPPEAAARLARPLGDGRHPAPVRGVEVQHPIALPVADRPEHHRLRLQRPGHVSGVGAAGLSLRFLKWK